MRHDTRKEILDTAKQLFNESGYNNVSTRDISEALGISKGNLTYYFKKKEEIIEALLTENPSTRIAQAPATIMELNAFFEDIKETVQEKAFYFWHHAQLAQLSPAIHKMQKDTLKENTALLTQAFHALKTSQRMRSEHFTGEYDRVIDTLLLAAIYWTPFCRLKETKEHTYSDQAWGIVYPYLTNAGAEDLRAI